MENQEAIKKEYHKLAKTYDTTWKSYSESTYTHALKLSQMHKEEIVLDASGGTGLFAQQLLATTQTKVTLLDISHDMLAVAKARLKNTKAVIEEGDVHRLPHETNTFTIVFTLNALHFYAHPRKALREFNRVLKKKGQLIIIDWCRNPWNFKLYDAWKRTFDKSHIKSYTPEELKIMLQDSGFNVKKIIQWTHEWWPLIGIQARKQ